MAYWEERIGQDLVNSLLRSGYTPIRVSYLLLDRLDPVIEALRKLGVEHVVVYGCFDKPLEAGGRSVTRAHILVMASPRFRDAYLFYPCKLGEKAAKALLAFTHAYNLTQTVKAMSRIAARMLQGARWQGTKMANAVLETVSWATVQALKEAFYRNIAPELREEAIEGEPGTE